MITDDILKNMNISDIETYIDECYSDGWLSTIEAHDIAYI